ncbi:hypothetical protein B9479_006563, partial [Cryptococcus floricola]
TFAHINSFPPASQCSNNGAPLTTFDTEVIDNDGMASFCPRCAGCITPAPSESDLMLHSFTKVPVLARGNGLFIGKVPIEIARLTMIEKLCIARARATRCCIKLQGHGASHVSKGNVVILPQAASELGRLLPLSATEIANEFVVINSRKISAFMTIKNGGKFLVYTSGSTPMREWVSPDTFAALLPDLFPYGCGVFEDPLRPKKVSFAAHVKHLLKLKDRRFAMHTTFPFICLMIQRRQSSHQASLQTSLSTFNHIASLRVENVHTEVELRG